MEDLSWIMNLKYVLEDRENARTSGTEEDKYVLVPTIKLMEKLGDLRKKYLMLVDYKIKSLKSGLWPMTWNEQEEMLNSTISNIKEILDILITEESEHFEEML